MINKKFHTRSFISFSLFVVIFWLLISGTVLYISPPGRVAHWQQWTLFGFSKDQWQAQHTIFSYVFILVAVVHIFSLNWRNLWSYIKLKSKTGLRKKREFFAAILFSILVFVGTNLDLPPFSSFYYLGEEIGFSWEEKQKMAPMPHTENLSLDEVAIKFLKIDTDEAITTLRKEGIMIKGKSQKLKEIAIENGTSPSHIYSLMSPGKESHGRGYGRMTIKEVAKDLGMEVNEIIGLLESKDIDVSTDSSIKDIAAKNQIPPSEIMQMIKGDH